MDEKDLSWSEVVRIRLVTWGAWVQGPQVYRNPGSPIAAMIARAAGELPGDDISVPRELTFELDVTEKALARMKLSGFSRDMKARKLIQAIYQYTLDFEDIARAHKWSPKMFEAERWRAESIVGRYMTILEYDAELLERYGRTA